MMLGNVARNNPDAYSVDHARIARHDHFVAGDQVVHAWNIHRASSHARFGQLGPNATEYCLDYAATPEVIEVVQDNVAPPPKHGPCSLPNLEEQTDTVAYVGVDTSHTCFGLRGT